jgi:membrane dipeptidase
LSTLRTNNEMITPNAGSAAISGSVTINTCGVFLDETVPGMADGTGEVLPSVTVANIADARDSGITTIVQTVGHVIGELDPFEISVRDVARWNALIEQNPDDLVRVLAASDIRSAHRDGKIGVLYATQNMTMIGESIDRIDLFHDLGFRQFQLTYNEQNRVGAGSTAPETKGLSDFGREVVDRLNSLHSIVDLSHSGYQTCLDAIAASSTPVALSHTGCRALVDIPRNKSDEEIRLVADSGGYIGIYFMPFLAPGRQITSEDIAVHLEHAIDIAGEDAVGIGTDGSFSPVADWEAFTEGFAALVRRRRELGVSAPGETEDSYPFASDLQGTDQYFRLADVLYARGHSETRIRKIMGENYLRYAEDVLGR